MVYTTNDVLVVVQGQQLEERCKRDILVVLQENNEEIDRRLRMALYRPPDDDYES